MHTKHTHTKRTHKVTKYIFQKQKVGLTSDQALNCVKILSQKLITLEPRGTLCPVRPFFTKDPLKSTSQGLFWAQEGQGGSPEPSQ